MGDFIERVGQSYLERKAFAVPQQLENIVKKQLTGRGEEEANAKKPTGRKITEEEEKGDKEEKRTAKKGSGKAARHTSISETDKEIARLKKQLAQLKLENSKASSSSRKSTFELKKSGISRSSNGQKHLTSTAAKGGKETKELVASGLVRGAGGKHIERKSKSRSKSGKKEASGSKAATEANIAEISPTPRRMSKSQHSEHDVGAKSEHGSGFRSEHGSHAGSTTSYSAATSDDRWSQSMSSHSEHGSGAKSIAPVPIHATIPFHAPTPVHAPAPFPVHAPAPFPVHPHVPVYPDWHGEDRRVVQLPREHLREEQERDLYAIEVEEEGGEDSGGVVEVECSQGKMVYRID